MSPSHRYFLPLISAKSGLDAFALTNDLLDSWLFPWPPAPRTSENLVAEGLPRTDPVASRSCSINRRNVGGYGTTGLELMRLWEIGCTTNACILHELDFIILAPWSIHQKALFRIPTGELETKHPELILNSKWS